MHDDVGAVEGLAQRVGVADVALPVLHLRPAALGRVERTAGDADDPRDPVVVLEQRDQAGAEGAGRAGDGDGQPALAPAHRGGPSPVARRRRASSRAPAAAAVFFAGARLAAAFAAAARRRSGCSGSRPGRLCSASASSSSMPAPDAAGEHVDVGVAVEVGVDAERHRVQVGEDADRAARAAGDRHVGVRRDHPLAEHVEREPRTGHVRGHRLAPRTARPAARPARPARAASARRSRPWR